MQSQHLLTGIPPPLCVYSSASEVQSENLLHTQVITRAITQTHTHTHTHTHAHTCTYTHTHKHTRARAYNARARKATQSHVLSHTYTRTHTRTHTHKHAHSDCTYNAHARKALANSPAPMTTPVLKSWMYYKNTFKIDRPWLGLHGDMGRTHRL